LGGFLFILFFVALLQRAYKSPSKIPINKKHNTMSVINRDGKRIKVKGFTFQSLANATANYDIQQPGDCNTLLGFNIYTQVLPTVETTQGKKMSLTINSLQLLDNICATEANPVLNNSAKTMLNVNAPLAGNDTIKLTWTDTVAATYIINIYYLF
jgi:hypothetical protein